MSCEAGFTDNPSNRQETANQEPPPGRRPILTLKGFAEPTAPSAVKPPPLLPPTTPAPQPAAVANPVARPKREFARLQAAQWLGETYPAVFGVDMKPLAIGVGRMIWPHAKAVGIKRRALNDALQRRTTLIAYLDAVARDGAMRFDLEGAVGEPVRPEHRQRAIDMKAERLAKALGARKGQRP